MSDTHFKLLELSLHGNTMYEIPIDLWAKVEHHFWIFRRGHRMTVQKYLDNAFTKAEQKRIKVIKNYQLPKPKRPQILIYDEVADWTDREDEQTSNPK